MTSVPKAELSGLMATICAVMRVDAHAVRGPLALLLVFLTQAAMLEAQHAIRGVIRDSLAGTTLAGARVTVIPAQTPWAAGQTAVSDTNGLFSVGDLPAGRYVVGFQHPRLDSLGFDGVSRTIDVSGSPLSPTLEFALPSARTLVATLCGEMPAGLGMMIGRLLRADSGRPVATGTIVAEWREMTLGAADGAWQRRSIEAITRDDGRYVLCGVPTDVTVIAIARDTTMTGATTGRIDLEMPSGTPLLHRNLLVPGPDLVERGAADSQQAPLPARLRGYVMDDSKRPVAGARLIVRETGSRDTIAVTDSSGAYRFRALRGGTVVITVDKIGMTPVRSAVDLMEQRETTASFVLTRPAFELEQVTVSARAALEQAGFDSRRLSRRGFFLTGKELADSDALFVSQVLMAAPMLMQWGSNWAGRPVLSGPLRCTPQLFVDGVPAPMPAVERSSGRTPFTRDQSLIGAAAYDSRPDIDNVVPFGQLSGIEVYAPGEAPARFADPSARCSSIVIWSKGAVR